MFKFDEYYSIFQSYKSVNQATELYIIEKVDKL